MNDIVPLDLFDKTIKQWWLIVVLMILGGLVGGLVHVLRPPLYQARAVLTTSLDFVQTGPLDEISVDYAFEAASALIESTKVKDQIIVEAQARQIAYDMPEIIRYMERMSNQTWLLQVRSADPHTAADLANLWAEVAYQQLGESSLHAQQARNLANHLKTLEGCLLTAAGEPVCGGVSLEQVQAEIASTSTAQQVEIEAARGISAALSFDWSEHAEVPSRPASFGRNTLVMAGSLIGFLVAIVAIYADAFESLKRLLRRG